jgi:hypothetical protein
MDFFLSTIAELHNHVRVGYALTTGLHYPYWGHLCSRASTPSIISGFKDPSCDGGTSTRALGPSRGHEDCIFLGSYDEVGLSRSERERDAKSDRPAECSTVHRACTYWCRVDPLELCHYAGQLQPCRRESLCSGHEYIPALPHVLFSDNNCARRHSGLSIASSRRHACRSGRKHLKREFLFASHWISLNDGGLLLTTHPKGARLSPRCLHLNFTKLKPVQLHPVYLASLVVHYSTLLRAANISQQRLPRGPV